MTTMEDDTEICRVCRCGATVNQPLYYPCKCSGSIRYVHQDCLTEWLSHSKKKYCELCEHSFSFTPVYQADMPESLPLNLLLSQLKKKLVLLLHTSSRALFVSFIWLIVLPYFTVSIWSFFFWSGESLALRLGHTQHKATLISSLVTDTTNSATQPTKPSERIFANITTEISVQSLKTLAHELVGKFGKISLPLDAKKLASDCFQGQIITCVVLVVFVAGFLFREWLIQNIPDEHIMDDDDDPMPNIQAMDDQAEMDQHDEGHLLGDESLGQEPVANHLADIQLNETVLIDDRHDSPEGTGPSGSDRSGSVSSAEDQMDGSDEYHHLDFSLDGNGEPPHSPFLQPTALPFSEQARHNEIEEIGLPQLPVEINQEPVQNDNEGEFEEENVGDGIDGVLEAVGMRGSLWMLAQNSALMALLITLCLGAAVWIPYIIGIIFIMVIKPVEWTTQALYAAAKVIDPVLDLIFHVCSEYLWPVAKGLYDSKIGDLVTQYITRFRFVIPAMPSTVQQTSDAIFDSSVALLTTSMNHAILQWWTSYDQYKETFYVILDQIEPTYQMAVARYLRFATGTSGIDRFMCVLTGYVVLITVAYGCLTCGPQTYAKLGKTPRHAIKQQGVIFKVGMFVAIELLLFPIICGILLDLSTLSLFPSATVVSRIHYTQTHPFVSVFLHWVIGTAFMFIFAVLVTTCRDLIRPGVMWFIRDPNDPQFHPIKEIVERPVLSQLQKLGASGFMYALFIVTGVGGTIWMLHMVGQALLPFQWEKSQPYFTAPIEFLVIHTVIPYTFRYFQIKAVIRRMVYLWMTFLCKKLRLTSYMFGGRHIAEEGSCRYKTWRAWIQRAEPQYPISQHFQSTESQHVLFQRDGTLVLAPKHDNVPFVHGRRMLVPIDPLTQEILDTRERALGHPASSTTAGGMDNVVVVYLPPDFEYRMSLFLGIMWISFSLFLCGAILGPIATGRWLCRRLIPSLTSIHDGHAFFIGATTLLYGGHLLKMIILAGMEVGRQATIRPKTALFLKYAKQSIIWVTKLIYVTLSFGIILPILFGMITELYVFLPLQELGSEAPKIHIVLVWAQGLVTMSIVHKAATMLVRHNWLTDLETIFQQGLGNVDLLYLTTRIIVPLEILCLAVILFPFVGAVLFMKIRSITDPAAQIKTIQRIYPLGIISLWSLGATVMLEKFRENWIQAIREDTYLIGRILHNFDERE